MPFNLTEIDKALIQSSILSFSLESVDPIDDFPPGGGQIAFQFPPLITTDTKKAKWESQDITKYEPFFIFKGGGPRNIAVKAVYIVGGPREGLLAAAEASNAALGGASSRGAAAIARAASALADRGAAVGEGWTTKRGAEEVSRWKSYFYINGVKIGNNLPIFRIVWHQLLPEVDQASAWRGEGYNIKYSDTVIRDDEGEYPLITEVTVNLALVSRIATGDADEVKQQIENIPNSAKQQWY